MGILEADTTKHAEMKEKIAHMPFQAVVWHSFRAVVCILRHLDLKGLSSQVFARFGWTKFIAWCLRRPIRGVPTGLRIFLPAARESRLVSGPHHKKAFCHTLTRWYVRQIPFHQRDKHLGCPPRKRVGTILKVDEKRTSINGQESKKTHEDA